MAAYARAAMRMHRSPGGVTGGAFGAIESWVGSAG
jgi:hypothetical protein